MYFLFLYVLNNLQNKSNSHYMFCIQLEWCAPLLYNEWTITDGHYFLFTIGMLNLSLIHYFMFFQDFQRKCFFLLILCQFYAPKSTYSKSSNYIQIIQFYVLICCKNNIISVSINQKKEDKIFLPGLMILIFGGISIG